MIYISEDGVQGYVGSLGLIPWSKKEENIMEGNEEVGSKENFEQNKEDYN
jgi:hypothetical protein